MRLLALYSVLAMITHAVYQITAVHSATSDTVARVLGLLQCVHPTHPATHHSCSVPLLVTSCVYVYVYVSPGGHTPMPSQEVSVYMAWH